MNKEEIEKKTAENKAKIGSTVKKYRKLRNLPQIELAEYLNVSSTTIGRYENAVMEMPSSYLGIISEKLKFNPSEYFIERRKPIDILTSIAAYRGLEIYGKRPKTPADEKTDEKLVDDLLHIEWLTQRNATHQNEQMDEVIDMLVDDVLVELQRENRSLSARLRAYWEGLQKH